VSLRVLLAHLICQAGTRAERSHVVSAMTASGQISPTVGNLDYFRA